MKPNIGQGDNGMTSLLGGGTKVPKDNMQVEAYGSLDELVALLGYIKIKIDPKKGRSDPPLFAFLEKIQDHLFRIASHVSASSESARAYLPYLGDEHIEFLEDAVVRYEKNLPELQNFILPGGTELSTLFHIARTQARRVERKLVTAERETKLHPRAVPYVNRLSDVFFTLARWTNQKAGVQDLKWVGLGKKGI